MKIIFVDPFSTGDFLGGAQMSLFQIMSKLKDKNHEIILAVPGGSHFSNKAELLNISVEYFYLPRLFSTRLKIKNIKIFNLFSAISNVFLLFFSGISLYKIIRRTKPDIVHSNQVLISIAAGVACFISKTKCVWHIRENPSKHISNYILKIYGIFGCILSDCIIVNSKFTANFYKKTSLFNKIKIIPIGVEKTIINKNKFKENSNKNRKIISIFGRIIPSKGHILLLKAIKLIETAKFNFHISIFGEYQKNDNYVLSLLQYVKNSDLISKIKFHGYVDNIDNFILATDLVVAPSIESESFGRTLVESMSAKVPIIASNIGAHTEIIKDNIDGFIFDPNNINELAEKIKFVMEHKESRNKIINNAYKKYKKYFSIEVYIDSIENIYQNLND